MQTAAIYFLNIALKRIMLLVVLTFKENVQGESKKGPSWKKILNIDADFWNISIRYLKLGFSPYSVKTALRLLFQIQEKLISVKTMENAALHG